MISISRVVLVIGGCWLLSACAQSSLRMNPEFGNALRQDIASQIADPDARYEGTPAPGSSGPRAALAGKRYDANQVIPPSAITASSNKSIGNADNGAGGGTGGGAGGGASAGMSR